MDRRRGAKPNVLREEAGSRLVEDASGLEALLGRLLGKKKKSAPKKKARVAMVLLDADDNADNGSGDETILERWERQRRDRRSAVEEDAAGHIEEMVPPESPRDLLRVYLMNWIKEIESLIANGVQEEYAFEYVLKTVVRLVGWSIAVGKDDDELIAEFRSIVDDAFMSLRKEDGEGQLAAKGKTIFMGKWVPNAQTRGMKEIEETSQLVIDDLFSNEAILSLRTRCEDKTSWMQWMTLKWNILKETFREKQKASRT